MPDDYREANPEELRSLDPKTPRVLDGTITISCPNGKVMDTKMVFENGSEVMNCMRALISLEPPMMAANGKGNGDCLVYLTRFNNEIGKVVHEVANCVLGFPQDRQSREKES